MLGFICYTLGTIVRDVNKETIANFCLKKHGSGCVWPQPISFEEKIAFIQQKVGDWEDPAALFQSKDFEAIYRYPIVYQYYVKQLLAQPTVSVLHKKIALYAMEQLDVASYVSIVNDCYTCYMQGAMPLELCMLSLGYRLAGDHPIVKNYQRKEVKACLDCMLQSHALGPLYNHLLEIQTGAMWQSWQHEKVGSGFHFPKHPLPFQETVDRLLNDARYMGNDYCLEGHIKGPDFMMLYEHPSYYVEDAHSLLDNPLAEPNAGLISVKYTLNRLRNQIVCNALRKLEESSFMRFLKKLYTVDPYHKLIKGTAGSYYDTLLLQPYPLPFNLSPAYIPPNQDKLPCHSQFQSLVSSYKEEQQKQAKLRLLYGIPMASKEKPFYWFDQELQPT